MTLRDIQIFNVDGLLIVARYRSEAVACYQQERKVAAKNVFQLYRTGYLNTRLDTRKGSVSVQEAIEHGLRHETVPFILAEIMYER